MTITPDIVATGVLQGLAYGLLAVGLVLIYRATRVVSFAHGEIGAVAAAVLAKVVLDLGWNWYVAFGVALVVGAAFGALVELTIVRRLMDAPRIVLMIATISVAQLLFFVQAVLPTPDTRERFPTGLDRSAELVGVQLRGEHFMILAFVPGAVFALHLFLTRTPLGLALRASAENASAALLAGVDVRRVSLVVWSLSGALAAATVILINPIRGAIVGIPAVALGPTLLLRALVAALIGRFESLPLVVAGGVGVGVIEAIAFSNVATPGLVELVLLVVVGAAVLTRGRSVRAGDGRGEWTLAGRMPEVPLAIKSVVHSARTRRWTLGAVAAAGLLAPLLAGSASQQFLVTRVLLYALAGISVVIVTGWAGQLSLAQFAFVGLGSMVAGSLQMRGVPFVAAVVLATFAGALAAAIIGLPALRIRGMMLGVVTLGFAVAARQWLLPHDVFFGESGQVLVQVGSVGPFDLSDGRTFYYLCLGVLAAVAIAVAHVRETGWGRSVIATRENESAASSLTISPTAAKLTAFGLSGAVAALSGALLAALRVQYDAADFGPEESLRILAMTIIGGVGSVWGAVLGAVYVLGLPALVEDSVSIRLLTSGVGLLLVLLYLPGGLVELLVRIRDAVLLRLIHADSSDDVDASPPPDDEMPAARRASATERTKDTAALTGRRPLEVTDVSVCFGGLTAVDGVSLHVEPGEILGIIGSNGAGKSTLMDAISGFTPSSGSVEVLGVRVDHLTPTDRARLGMGRVFQDAALFGDLTVHETLMLALEAHERSELVPSLLSLPPSRRVERWRRARAEEIGEQVGLSRYLPYYVGDLSTGTRRMVELGCLLCAEPSLVLLDEPTAGLAQREVESFAPVIRDVREQLDAAFVVIEHDIPMMRSLVDRMYCLASGSVIASGVPDDVVANPAVVASYLGTTDVAIARSGSVAPA